MSAGASTRRDRTQGGSGSMDPSVQLRCTTSLIPVPSTTFAGKPVCGVQRRTTAVWPERPMDGGDGLQTVFSTALVDEETGVVFAATWIDHGCPMGILV